MQETLFGKANGRGYFRFRDELERIMQLLPHLSEKEWFDIPAYGTDEWANWMIDLHQKKTTINVVFTMYLQYLL